MYKNKFWPKSSSAVLCWNVYGNRNVFYNIFWYSLLYFSLLDLGTSHDICYPEILAKLEIGKARLCDLWYVAFEHGFLFGITKYYILQEAQK